MHGEFLRLTDDKPEATEVADLVEQGRWREADLDEKDRRMLEYAEAITVAPASIEERHIQGLQGGGIQRPGHLRHRQHGGDVQLRHSSCRRIRSPAGRRRLAAEARPAPADDRLDSG